MGSTFSGVDTSELKIMLNFQAIIILLTYGLFWLLIADGGVLALLFAVAAWAVLKCLGIFQVADAKNEYQIKE